MTIPTVISMVETELLSATKRYGPFRSSHEGYAVIKEELDELWEEIRKKPYHRSHTALRKEAIQVAAMAARFVLDLNEKTGKI